MSDITAKDLIDWLIGGCTLLLGILWKGQEKRIGELRETKADKNVVEGHKQLVDAQISALIERLNRDDSMWRTREEKMDIIIRMLQDRPRR